MNPNISSHLSPRLPQVLLEVVPGPDVTVACLVLVVVTVTIVVVLVPVVIVPISVVGVLVLIILVTLGRNIEIKSFRDTRL